VYRRSAVERRAHGIRVPGEQHSDPGEGLHARRVVIEDDDRWAADRAHGAILLSYRLGSEPSTRENVQPGDVVTVSANGIGKLTNPVVQATALTR